MVAYRRFYRSCGTHWDDQFMPRLFLIGAVIAIATLVGCTASIRDRAQPAPPTNPRCCTSVKVTASRTAIVRTAAKLVGAKTIVINGRRIAYDCAGVTRAIFLEHGIDLYEGGTTDPKANGVRLIYQHIGKRGKFHEGPAVRPGDLVFFDNTWDYNGDGFINDPLTHVGIVERQEPDGTVIFISRVAGAISRYRMNLALPHVHKTAAGRILNDYIRRKDISDPPATGYLTGQLFAGFGTRI
jgi:hypothetical protein